MMLIFLSLLCLVPNKYKLTYEEMSIVVEPEKFELHDYLPLKSVAELLRLGYIMDNTTQQLHLTEGARRFVLIPDVRTVEYGGHYYHLPYAPVYRNVSADDGDRLDLYPRVAERHNQCNGVVRSGVRID